MRGAAAVVYDPSLCLPLPEGTDRIMAIWLIPTLASLFLYGIGQGLVKKYISEVPPARFCLYFVAAKAILNLSYFALFQKTELISTLGTSFSLTSILAYLVDGVVHYAVTNMPAACARTSTQGLTNATLPFALKIATLGYKKALKEDPHLLNGLNVYRGKVTNAHVAEDLGYEYHPPFQALG